MSNQIDNLEFYTQNAESFSGYLNKYKTVDSVPGFCRAVESFVMPGKSVLDLGCGPGRDCLWLAQRDWEVLGLDGSQAMLDIALQAYPHKNISWVCDVAPSLRKIERKKFHCVLMAAFIFHLNEDDRKIIYKSLEKCLEQDAMIYVTTYRGRPLKGRETYGVSIDEIQELAAQWGMSFKDYGEEADLKYPEDSAWRQMILWRGDAWNKVMTGDFDE